jgi:hypothetical protein
MVGKIVLSAIFCAAILHPFVHSFLINWQLYQLPPPEATPKQFYQVASARWVGVPSNHNRWRGPEPGVDETVMYFNLQKNIGTITWYGSFTLRENAAAKFLIGDNGTTEKNPNYEGEVYCATVQKENCDIEHFAISYNRLTVNTGNNFTALSKIVFNFNYDPRWSSRQAIVVNHNGLLAVALSDDDIRNRAVVLDYRDNSFHVGFAFFLIGGVVWPIWYFSPISRRLGVPGGPSETPFH